MPAISWKEQSHTLCPSSWPRTEKEEEDRQCRLDGGAVDAKDDGDVGREQSSS